MPIAWKNDSIEPDTLSSNVESESIVKSSRLRGLWRHPDFLKMWGGQTVSLFGSQVSLLAIPLTAVLVLNATALQMGILTALGTLPTLLFGLFAGVWVDRLHRSPILIVADAGRFLLLCLIPLSAVTGILHIGILYVLTFLVGILTIFFNVAYRSYLPSLIEREQLIEGNSKLELSQSVSEIVGPGLAGTLVQILTAPVAILIDAFSFLVSALSLAWIHTPEQRPESDTKQKGMLREIAEGLRFVFGKPILRALTSSFATLTLFNSVLEAVFILYLTRALGITPVVLGIIFAISSIGFLLGALLAGWLTHRIGIGITLLLTPLVIGGSDLLIPLAGQAPLLAIPLIGLAQLLFGLARPVFSINQVSLRQALTPERLQGRMNASVSFVVFGIPAIGALLGGVLGQDIGLQKTLIIAAAGEILACLWIFFSPVRRLREELKAG
ncbi:MAG: MFS transporter [Chloroflexi bacterium]|nr:MAG: MFS transporter [Chloroflexota bacterium]